MHASCLSAPPAYAWHVEGKAPSMFFPVVVGGTARSAELDEAFKGDGRCPRLVEHGLHLVMVRDIVPHDELQVTCGR